MDLCLLPTRRKNTYTFFYLLYATITLLEAGRHRNDLITNTRKGKVRGIRYHLSHLGKAVDCYLGIPFAKPPIGALRFRHPQPPDKWKGIYNATKLPKSCYQIPDSNFGDFEGENIWKANTRLSEDCLYLNVWVPKRPSRSKGKVAVLVWIYGGGFYSGSSTLNIYDAKILAALHDVIVVSMQYRLGALGFITFGHPSAPGNAGMFDQLMALEWVQQNIHYFGGDPNSVTLFGESAGSVSVSLHLLSPLSRNKFNRVVLQSGVANMPWATFTMEEGKQRSWDLAEVLGCPITKDIDEVMECMRSVHAQLLVDSQWVSRGVAQFPFIPVIDGAFLSESPIASLEKKNFKKCPVLLGSNYNEGTFFLIYELFQFMNLTHRTMTREQFVVSLQKLFYHYPQYPNTISEFGNDAIIFQYTNWLNPHDQDANLAKLDEAVGDAHFLCSVNKFAHYYATAGENVYSYYFTQRYSSNPWPKWMGVLHADEIMFIFGLPLKQGANYTKDEKQLARKIMQYWTNFAKTGDPNRAPGKRSLDEWPLHTPVGKEYLELNAKFLHTADKSLAVGRGPRSQECAFWHEYLPRLLIDTESITEAEKRWKNTFHQWSTEYIVDWKLRYDLYLKNKQRCKGT